MALKRLANATGNSKITAALFEVVGEPAEKTLKFNAGDDLLIASGQTVKYSSNEKPPRSVRVEAGGTFARELAEMTIGAATANAENYILDIKGTWTLGALFTINFQSTAGVVQAIKPGGVTLANEGALKFKSGKCKVEGAALKILGATGQVTVEGSAELDMGGQTIESGELLQTGTSVLNIEGATVKLTPANAGTGWSSAEAAEVKMNSSTVIEVVPASESAVEYGFAGGGNNVRHEYKGTVTFALKGEASIKVSGLNAPAGSTVKLDCKGCKVRLLRTSKQAWLGTVSTNGTEASPLHLESTEAAKSAELEVAEQQTGESPGAVGFIKLKDVTVVKGVWYLPKGAEEGGNVLTIGTTVKFEAKPAGGTVFTDTPTGSMKATGVQAEILAFSETRTGTLHPAGTASDTLAFADTRTGTITIKGTSADALAFVEARTGTLTLKGTSALAEVHTATVQGHLTLTGSQAFAETHTTSPTGRMTLTGSDTDTFTHGFSDNPTGSLTLTGTRTFAETHTTTPAGRITITGARTETVAFVSAPTGRITLAGVWTEEYLTGVITHGVLTLTNISSPAIALTRQSGPAIGLTGKSTAAIPLTRQEP